ncbi:MAG: hypothetical protein AABZ60_02920, partial [Planctomycetota bacterium]
YESWFQGIIQGPIQKFDQEFYSKIQPQIGLSMEEFFSIPSGQISLVWHDFSYQSGMSAGPEHISASVVLEFSPDYAKKVQELLDKLANFIDENVRKSGEELVTNESQIYGGKIVEFSFVQNDGAPRAEKIYYGIHQNYLILGLQNKEALEMMFQALSGKTLSNSLVQSDIAKESVSLLPKNSFTRGFVNLRRVYDIILMSVGEMAPMVEMYAPILGLHNLNSASFALTAQEEMLETTIFVSCPGEKQGVMKFLDVKPGDLTPQNFVSNQIMSYMTCYYSLTELYREILKKVGEIDPNTLAQLEAGLQQIKEASQMDIEQDILGSLGQRFSLILYGMLNKEMPDMVVLMEVANMEKFIRARELLLQMIGADSLFLQEEYLGKTLWTLKPEMMPAPLSPCFMTDNNLFCVSLTQNSLKNFIRQSNEQSALITELPAYQKLLTYQIPHAGMLIFSNATSEEYWQGILNASEPSQFEQFGINVSQLPDYAQIRPYLPSNLMTYRCDEHGFFIRSLYLPQK